MSPPHTVFYGTFIDLPRTKSGQKHDLLVRHGALWVSANGTIEGMDWTVGNDRDLHALLRRKGWVDNVHLVRAQSSQNEFFFPGFIGTPTHRSPFSYP